MAVSECLSLGGGIKIRQFCRARGRRVRRSPVTDLPRAVRDAIIRSPEHNLGDLVTQEFVGVRYIRRDCVHVRSDQRSLKWQGNPSRFDRCSPSVEVLIVTRSVVVRGSSKVMAR